MKKDRLLIGIMFILSIFLVSCKSSNIDDEITIDRNYSNEENMSGMGFDYKIKNLAKGKYNINLYSKEFEKSKFVKEESLYNKTVDLDKNINEVDISIYQENEEIKISIGKSTLHEITLDFFKTDIFGIALFGIETEKKLVINEELPIMGYITGDNVKNIQNTNIDDIFNEKSTNEIIIYLKISNIE